MITRLLLVPADPCRWIIEIIASKNAADCSRMAPWNQRGSPRNDGILVV
jgi:hypothetical protein